MHITQSGTGQREVDFVFKMMDFVFEMTHFVFKRWLLY